MLAYILIAVFAVFLLVLYKGFIKPYKIFRFYKNQFKEKKLRSFSFPFVPFAAPSIINAIRE